MKLNKRTISQIEAAQRNLSADELAQFSRIYEVDVRELLFLNLQKLVKSRDLQLSTVLSLNYMRNYLIVILKMFIG